MMLDKNMDEILYTLCRGYCIGIRERYPLPATVIAEFLNLSVHKVRYHLRKLKQQGLVYSFYEGGADEDGDMFCLHGWGITKSAFCTAEYKLAYEDTGKIADVFDM